MLACFPPLLPVHKAISGVHSEPSLNMLYRHTPVCSRDLKTVLVLHYDPGGVCPGVSAVFALSEGLSIVYIYRLIFTRFFIATGDVEGNGSRVLVISVERYTHRLDTAEPIME